MNPVISGRRVVSLALAALLVTFGLVCRRHPARPRGHWQL